MFYIFTYKHLFVFIHSKPYYYVRTLIYIWLNMQAITILLTHTKVQKPVKMSKFLFKWKKKVDAYCNVYWQNDGLICINKSSSSNML